MLYCGDDPSAKATVASLIDALGFVPLDAGPLNMAGLLEAAALLWIRISIQSKDRNFAFARIHR
jgi:predicted dinucleotide-binding enzyme